MRTGALANPDKDFDTRIVDEHIVAVQRALVDGARGYLSERQRARSVAELVELLDERSCRIICTTFIGRLDWTVTAQMLPEVFILIRLICLYTLRLELSGGGDVPVAWCTLYRG